MDPKLDLAIRAAQAWAMSDSARYAYHNYAIAWIMTGNGHPPARTSESYGLQTLKEAVDEGLRMGFGSVSAAPQAIIARRDQLT